jgi:hypothetical protein
MEIGGAIQFPLPNILTKHGCAQLMKSNNLVEEQKSISITLSREKKIILVKNKKTDLSIGFHV